MKVRVADKPRSIFSAVWERACSRLSSVASKLAPTFAVLLLGLLLAGCAPSDPLDQVVEARTPLDYDIWANRQLAALSPPDAADYTRAFHELRIFSVTQWTGRPPEEQYQHVLDQLHGLKVRAVIAQGLQCGNQRLGLLLEQDRAAMKRKEYLITTPSTTEQLVVLRQAMKDMTRRIAVNEEEIRRNESVIRRVSPGGAPPAAKAKPPI